MKKLKTILQYRYTFKVITFLVLVFALISINFIPKESKYTVDETIITGIVTYYHIEDNKLSLDIKGKETIKATYYFDTEEEEKFFEVNLLLGDTLKLEGVLSIPKENTVPNTFNYKKYLENKSIYYIMAVKKISISKKNTSIIYEIKNIITKRIDKIDKTGYLRTFILGDKQNLDNEMITIYQENGISHLFAISGMHITFLISILSCFLDKLTYNKYIKAIINIIFLLYYLFLTSCSPSILRATIMFILICLNKCFNLKITKLDMVLLTLDIILIINPYIVYDIGFQFSYLISFTLVLLTKKISAVKHKVLSSLYISWICFLISLPICIYNFYQVNFLSIILNLFFIPFVSIILFPFCLIVFIFPFLENILIILIRAMEISNQYIGQITFFQIIFAKPNFIVVIIYYILICLVLYSSSKIKYLLLVILIHKNIAYLNPNMEILMIDVSQGDSIFVRLPFNQGNFLIDTGGVVSYNNEISQEDRYSIVKSKTIPYLKSIGVDKLDYLILTHGDYDHIGEASNLIDNFKISSVIFNKGEYNNLESGLINKLFSKKIDYYQSLDNLMIDKFKIYFLQDKVYDNENENSQIIYFSYNGYKVLLMGDASSQNEINIIKKYNLENIDILKVGHHGSKTSSCEKFILKVNPQISLISVGGNNRYGHPHQEVLDNLKQSHIYRTDKLGSILIKINDNIKIYSYSSWS